MDEFSIRNLHMINKALKTIFIHIPRTAGSSVEIALGRTKKHGWGRAHRDILFGWDSIFKIHLQHATIKELIDFRLVNKNNLADYFKFTIVRNPWERAVSDFVWLNIDDTFRNYLLQKGKFEYIAKNKSSKDTRYDHFRPQADFIFYTDNNLMDFVAKYETLQKDWNKICSNIGLKITTLGHTKQTKHKHYSTYYDSETKKLVEKLYQKDIDIFNYTFEGNNV